MNQFTVISVIDGDTFDVEGWIWEGKKGTRVRPTGYNTPELPSQKGLEAKKMLEYLILGKTVEIGNAYTVDRGRLVADVYFHNRNLADYFEEYKI